MNADHYSTGPIPTVRINNDEYTLTADVGYLTTEGDLRILGRGSECVNADACGDLIGLEEDLKLLSGITDAVATVNATDIQVDLFLVHHSNTDIDSELIRYMATRLGAQRGVHLPMAVHLVERLHFNSTGKFDLAQTLTQL